MEADFVSAEKAQADVEALLRVLRARREWLSNRAVEDGGASLGENELDRSSSMTNAAVTPLVDDFDVNAQYHRVPSVNAGVILMFY